ncbi:hypothetical protein JW948_12715 [bacterium]|nr:hypothetical protein [bacterium]
MLVKDQSIGFEIELPDQWRKLLLFEHVKGNRFKGLLPGSLSEGPVFAGPDNDSLVISVQKSESEAPEAYRETVKKMADEANLTIGKFDSFSLHKETHLTVVWKTGQGDVLKTYFIMFGQLSWAITFLCSADESVYDGIVSSFKVLPLVQKMMT